MKPILLAGLLLLTSGCAPALAPLPAAPAPIVIRHTPAVRYIQPAFQSCSNDLQPMTVLVHEVPAGQINTQAGGLVLSAVDPVDAGLPAYQVYEDRLAVIIHPGNTLASIPHETLAGILQGFITGWQDAGGPVELNGTQILVAGYGADSELQRLAESRLAGDHSFGYATVIFEDPASLLAYVEANPGAIGILPSSMIADRVRELRVQGLPPDSLVFPVLAQVPADADPAVTAFLGCLIETLE